MVEFRTEIVVQEILEANYMWWGIMIRPGNCRDFSSWKRMEHDKQFIAEAIPR